MKALLVVFALLAAGLVGLGFYRGWFSFASDSNNGKANLVLTVNKDQIREDKKTGIKTAQELGNKVTGNDRETDSVDGAVVSISDDKLTMTNEEGKEHDHLLTADVKITCDGKVCTPTDLKSGMRIRVTTNRDAPHAVSQIEALDKNPEFANVG